MLARAVGVALAQTAYACADPLGRSVFGTGMSAHQAHTGRGCRRQRCFGHVSPHLLETEKEIVAPETATVYRHSVEIQTYSATVTTPSAARDHG
jgi:hypothetical protein